jgi:hypothetical protein
MSNPALRSAIHAVSSKSSDIEVAGLWKNLCDTFFPPSDGFQLIQHKEQSGHIILAVTSVNPEAGQDPDD